MSGTCVTIPSGLKNYKLIFHILCFGATATPNGHTLMVLQQWRFKVTLKPFIVLLELCAGKQTPVTSDFTQDCAFNRGLRHHGCFFTFLNSLTNYNIKCRCCENSTFLSRKCAFVFWSKLKSSRRISAKLPLLRRIPSAIKIALSLFSFLFFLKTFCFASYAAEKGRQIRRCSDKIASSIQFVCMSVCVLKGLKSESKICGRDATFNTTHCALRFSLFLCKCLHQLAFVICTKTKKK